MTELQRAEYDAWRQVCHDLTSRGAINKFDLDAPVGESRTSGQRLLNDIRAWGLARCALAAEPLASPVSPKLAIMAIIIADLERLARELPGVRSDGMSVGKAAVRAYYNATRVVRRAIGEEDA